MALSRFIAFVLAATALAGCCASGTGCPVNLPPDLATSDGLVSSQDGAQSSMGGSGRSNSAMMVDPGMEPRRNARQNSKRSYEEQMAEDRDADAALTRHLKICNGCGTSGPDAMATDGMADGMGTGRTARASRSKTGDNMSKTGDNMSKTGDNMSNTAD